MTGTSPRRRSASPQSHRSPEPPRSPRAAVSRRWKSVWKRCASCRSAAEATRMALITRQPERRRASAQKTGPSSPCSWTWERCRASAACATSSSVGLTKTPDELHPPAQRRGDPGRHRRIARRGGEPGQRMKPSAHAPRPAASSASSIRVVPQILTRVTRGSLDAPSVARATARARPARARPSRPLGGRARPVGEPRRAVETPPAARELQRDLLAGLAPREDA